ncbi:hypothetical protein F7725_020589 [Dissostichus mawsoni]|uniref:Thioredoxin domain-containing protein 17 n=2 Tax=Dissostichus TaxID=36199 RepID=A0A7J5YEZ5_DISMA|nr:hypothetical protein F7725_020589 [Dissostichus mawsoni]
MPGGRVRGGRDPGHGALFLRELVHSELRGDCGLLETCFLFGITLRQKEDIKHKAAPFLQVGLDGGLSSLWARLSTPALSTSLLFRSCREHVSPPNGSLQELTDHNTEQQGNRGRGSAQLLSSEREVKLMELLVLSAVSRCSDSGSSLSITMGAGGHTWVARLLVLAGMASLNKSCVETMAHYEEVTVRGYDEFSQAISERKGKDIFAYFSGNKDAQGKSWCPDCVTAEPVVRGEMTHLPEGSVFIYCQVGERAYWKDLNNQFKKTLKLSGVPTLLRYGTPQKLVEDECFKSDLVRMMFTED